MRNKLRFLLIVLIVKKIGGENILQDTQLDENCGNSDFNFGQIYNASLSNRNVAPW
jgi:hypothetical protein